jgi:hypothetical protein
MSMPGYVAKALQQFDIQAPNRLQHSPFEWVEPTYSQHVQLIPLADITKPLGAAGTTRLQEIIGVLLYYGRAIDNTILVALGSLAATQTKGTLATSKAAIHLLNYAASHPNATVRFHASEMCLHIHSDTSYLSESKARSCAGGIFFLSSFPLTAANAPPPKFNGAIHIVSSTMRNVLSSATEAEVGACFHNAQDACPLCVTLEEMNWPQPPTPIQVNNSCAQGIIYDTVKQRRSKAMDLRFYWVHGRVCQGHFCVHWQPGKSNLADYFTKHHSPKHHRKMRSNYLHEPQVHPAPP